MYLTYDEYKDYGGTLSDADFDRFAFRAEKEIDIVTQDRCKTLVNIPEEVERCMFELIGYLSKNTNNGSVSAIASFGNDGYSVTYADQKKATQQIYDIIYTYLVNTGLMYRGVD